MLNTHLRNTRVEQYHHYASRGFTIVELLIVVVVIGVLATITIVAFNGLQERARASAVSAALSQATRKLEFYAVENGGYPAALADAGISDGSNVSYQYAASAAPSSTYCVTGTQSSTSYWVSSSSKTPTKGACAGHFIGGAAPITNYALNPMLRSSSSSWSSVSRVADAQSSSGWAAEKPSTTHQLYFAVTLPAAATTGVYAIDLWLPSDETVESKVVRLWAEKTSSPWTQWVTLSPPVNVTITKTKQRFYTTFTKPNGETTGYFGVRDALNNRVRAAGAFVSETSGSPAFADGQSTGWVWNGAVDASTSTGPAS